MKCATKYFIQVDNTADAAVFRNQFHLIFFISNTTVNSNKNYRFLIIVAIYFSIEYFIVFKSLPFFEDYHDGFLK